MLRWLLLVLLVLLPQLAYAHVTKYDRKAFGYPGDHQYSPHPGDCRDTRAEILILHSRIPVTFDERGCRVVSGLWYDPYSNEWFTAADDLEIEHTIPLSWAWMHGAFDWSDAKRKQFGSDWRFLIPVKAAENQLKSNKPPCDGPEGECYWPPNKDFQCSYVLDYWLKGTREYGLLLDEPLAEVLMRKALVCGALLQHHPDD